MDLLTPDKENPPGFSALLIPSPDRTRQRTEVLPAASGLRVTNISEGTSSCVTKTSKPSRPVVKVWRDNERRYHKNYKTKRNIENKVQIWT